MLAFNLKNNLRTFRVKNTGNLNNLIKNFPKFKFSTLQDLEIIHTKIDKNSQSFQVIPLLKLLILG
jgi:hypothetical protein